MALNKEDENKLINSLFQDIGEDTYVQKDAIVDTITNVLSEYNLKTDLGFIEKIATLKIPGKPNEKVDLDTLPSELTDAAYLPVNTVADIALRQDLDLIISQIPEWFSALQITRDAICESDISEGVIARDIKFDREKFNDGTFDNIMAKIEEVEDRLELNDIIKNHIVFNTLEYGEGYIYCIPYAKVFNDLYKYRTGHGKHNDINTDMTDTSSILNGFGYGESVVEVSLKDTIVNDANEESSGKHGVFTEAEVMEINPFYGAKVFNEDGSVNKTETKKTYEKADKEFDEYMDYIASNIRYIGSDIALPVIEESAHDLRAVYNTKYHDVDSFIQESNNLFNTVMNDSVYMENTESNENDERAFDNSDSSIGYQFENIKGVYLKILPATKLIPIRIDRTVIGYYYISDLTRPEEAGQRKNSGVTGYTLRSPAVGYDNFAPDKLFCEKLASKIINNFDLKFMKDNIALHQQIVSILESHRFNDAMMRFIFIPAENVIQCTINKDGAGKGHSMLEPGLVTARMYMFLKLYSILYQINNSQVRVYNLRMSGLDTDYQRFVNDTIKKFSARRVTINDIFNYRSSMTKVSGFSEMVMPMGAGDVAPITFDKIDAAEAPINNELLEQLKNESINSTPVPSLMVQTGGESQIEFAKETELANTRFNTMVSSYKIDMNRDITKLYRRILRWETDIDPSLLKNLKYVFRQPAAKTLGVTVEMINNFTALKDTVLPIFLTPAELGESDKPSETAREFTKLLLHEHIPQIDLDHYEELADQARAVGIVAKLQETGKGENISDSGLEDESGEF